MNYEQRIDMFWRKNNSSSGRIRPGGVGIVFLGLGLTVLPVFGFIVAIPAFLASFPLLRSHLKKPAVLREVTFGVLPSYP
ncbi:MAG: hypothetical protein R2861_04325 [Desulfobacterales bacterium]